MSGSPYLVIDKSVAPETFIKVIEAKELLSSGIAASSAEAARKAGISRSAFYKYRDFVFPYEERSSDRIITVHAVLRDNPGALASFIAQFFDAGANILTVNQSIPVRGAAAVTVSARTNKMEISVDELLKRLCSLDSVKMIKNISGEK